ncbi:phosphoenolpyruvate synthase [Desmospora activa]|uniref:Rifampicin phosphotransferase n=1 Tax=Desmospora activa DSM 45169 TaxID=1121389 RepID=A0A2T4Z0T6_9BACL|nr:phosphoenolpyruvate synthase [Desmospora activa]PTM53332.1 pyruvate,water dikinase [Desmospora activa DSM 45169]
MSSVLHFRDIDQTELMVVGGKGVNLGELAKIEGLQVPEGFCVTTDAYKKAIDQNREFHALVDQLSMLKAEEREKIGEISGKIRDIIEATKIPTDVEEAVAHHLTQLGEEHAYAVRSSATAEDLPHASFAGQQDTYLNIIGTEAIVKHISKCWASLFTDRAVIYRIQNGFDHRQVYLSVIVQRMVFPQASGILFTADPVTSNRKVLSIDASFGLGEALVSGLVSADNYKVQDGEIIEKTIATKRVAIAALPAGGTEERRIEPDQQKKQTLTDEQILQLERMGRQIEAYFGCPQDIEWCLADDRIIIVQSRPITTLFPVPDGNDGQNRVYISVGHQQMMTEAIKPLGMSFFRLLAGEYPMHTAGGRLFIDLSHDLASPVGRKIVLSVYGKNDPLMKSALSSLIERKGFIQSLPRGKRVFKLGNENLSWALPIESLKIYRKNDPAIVSDLISRNEKSINELKQRIANVTGDELFSFILQDYPQFKKELYNPQSLGVIMVGLYASSWINKKMEKWLGEKNAADTLSQSVPHNITSEMGLALMDVADVVRQYPAVIQYFEHATDESFFEDLVKVEGGEAVNQAIRGYLEKYGMRCSGEIDITTPRWRERPTALIPMIVSNIKNFSPGASQSKFEQGRLAAEQKEQELLSRLERLPRGRQKAKKTKRMINILRNFIGYREYPKYALVWRFFIYKQALMKEAAKLVQTGVIQAEEDIFYLSFAELQEAVQTNRVNNQMIAERKADYAVFQKLTPPRVITSEGEGINGQYDTDHLPPGALAGNPVSAGVIEGRARVVLKMEDADLQEGDILVTPFTDPSWTPLFVSIKGLVTEVGGLMTHGAVIAREYGLPAVVGVENATTRIKDGQRIRINGTEGYVEIL